MIMKFVVIMKFVEVEDLVEGGSLKIKNLVVIMQCRWTVAE